MTGFLENVAKEVLSGKFGKPEQLCIVLPTRRAGLYLKKSLGKQHGAPLLAPEIFAIEDLITGLYPGRIVDSSEAIFLLYRSYLKVQTIKPEPFDEFCRWGITFLNDIQEIDKYLVDADQLFGNLEGIRELEGWSLNEENLTELQHKYLQFWKSLYQLYTQFKSDLTASSLAYQGMAIRELVSYEKHDLPWPKVLICGFNALNTAEHKLFQRWHKEGKGVFYWDADIYYYSDPYHEAGKFLREYVTAFKESKSTPRWISDELSSGKKQIHITGVPGNTLQAKYAGELLTSEKDPEIKTALVLADEAMLFPVLHSIPENIEKINVSMGFPMRMSAVAGFIEELLRLHEQAEKSGRKDAEGHLLFYHRNVIRLLKQPSLLLLLDHESKAAEVIRDIQRKNRIFIGRKSLLGYFTGKDRSIMEDLLSMNEKAAILSTLEKILRQGLEKLEAEDAGAEQEFFFEALNIISLIASYDKKYDYFRELRTLVAFIRQAFRNAAIPFYGEPLSGLQVMGLLETRALDFDRIILLSANEQVIPSARSNHSFIPYDLRRHFGLPTYHDRDAVFSYHFYRLIQRAKEIHCLYTTVKDVIGSGEKSRFLTQLENELPSRNPNVTIHSGVISIAPEKIELRTLEMPKDVPTMERLQDMASLGISPSAINAYLSCTLKFFFSHVAGLSESDEVEESVDYRTMGTAVHGAIEALYKPLAGMALTPENIRELQKVSKKTLEKSFGEFFSREDLLSGPNLLAFEAAFNYLDEFLKWDLQQAENARKAGVPFLLSAIEEKLEMELPEGIKIKGFVDRIDQLGNTVRIIDYKTGKVESRELKSADMPSLFSQSSKAKAVQLMVYGLLHGKKSDLDLVSGIYSFRSNRAGLRSVEIDGRPALTVNDLEEFRSELSSKIKELMDPERPFTQTEDLKICERCEFNTVCMREDNS